MDSRQIQLLNSKYSKFDLTATLTLNDILFSMVLGYGFSKFPSDPINNFGSVLLFLFTLAVGIVDWFGNHYYTKTVNDKLVIPFIVLEILTLLILTQLFASTNDSVKPQLWVLYFAIYLSLYIFWNLITWFNNRALYISILSLGTLSYYLLYFNFEVIMNCMPKYDLRVLLALCSSFLSLLSIFIYNKFTKGKLFDANRVKYADFFHRNSKDFYHVASHPSFRNFKRVNRI